MAARLRWLALVFLQGCSALMNGTVPDGARATLEADQLAPAEVALVCRQPNGFFTVDGTTVTEPAPVEAFSVRKAADGLILAEANPFGTVSYVTTNHWQSPLGDHFFSWGRDVGVEVIVGPGRASGLQLVYGPLPRDSGVYQTALAADGTTRPSGTPIAVATCIPLALAQQRKNEQAPMMVQEGVKPISSDAVTKPREFRVNQCMRNGGKDINTRDQSFGGHVWFWMPTGFIRDQQRRSYVTFSRQIAGAKLLYEVSPDATGHFQFRLGAVSYVGTYQVRPSKKDEIAVIVGTPEGGTLGELDCAYFWKD